MDDTMFVFHFDPNTSTLTFRGIIDKASMPEALQEIHRAYRRTACRLTLDLSHAQGLPPHLIGVLVHLCNTEFPGTFVRPPAPQRLAKIA